MGATMCVLMLGPENALAMQMRRVPMLNNKIFFFQPSPLPLLQVWVTAPYSTITITKAITMTAMVE